MVALIIAIIGSVTSDEYQPVRLTALKEDLRPRIKRVDPGWLEFGMLDAEDEAECSHSEDGAVCVECRDFAIDSCVHGMVGEPAEVWAIVYEMNGDREDLVRCVRTVYPEARHFALLQPHDPAKASRWLDPL